MFAPGISVVVWVKGSGSSDRLSTFLEFVKEKAYSEHINISVICVHSEEENIYSLAEVCKKFDALFALVNKTDKTSQTNFIRKYALSFTPTEQIVFHGLESSTSYSCDQSEKEILDVRLNNITTVIPTSSVSFVPPLRNCLASIRAQHFLGDINIIVTYVHNNSEEDLRRMVKLCAEYNAAILFHNHNHPCFPPALARNVGARRIINAVTAFIDADTVVHPYTFQKAINYLKDDNTVMHVEPAMMVCPKKEWFTNFTPSVFESNMKRGRYAPGTGACVFVPASVLEKTHGYDERFIGYGATDWDFTDRLKPLGIKLINLSKQEGNIRAMHQPHRSRAITNPPSGKNRRLYSQMKGKQPQRNPISWGGIPVAEYKKE